jgi:hypothetical protein
MCTDICIYVYIHMYMCFYLYKKHINKKNQKLLRTYLSTAMTLATKSLLVNMLLLSKSSSTLMLRSVAIDLTGTNVYKYEKDNLRKFLVVLFYD